MLTLHPQYQIIDENLDSENRYIIVEKSGSNLADIIRGGFYTTKEEVEAALKNLITKK